MNETKTENTSKQTTIVDFTKAGAEKYGPYKGKIYKGNDASDKYSYRIEGYAGVRVIDGAQRHMFCICRIKPGAIFLAACEDFLTTHTETKE